MKKQELVIVVPEVRIGNLELTLVGDSPLICHAWDEKTKKGMLDKQMKKAAPKKEAKDPHAQYLASLYNMPDGKGYGFPSIGFKGAAVSACRFSDGVKMTEARGAFHVEGELVRIDGTPNMREDMVRIGMGVADIRYRGEFKQWKATLKIRYNMNSLSPEQIVNLFNTAGFGVGVGEWRPEKNGQMGMFHVLTSVSDQPDAAKGEKTTVGTKKTKRAKETSLTQGEVRAEGQKRVVGGSPRH